MKQILMGFILGMVLVVQTVSADESSYQLLKGNTKKRVGANVAKNTECAFVADDDAVYFNLRGADLSQGVRAGYQELKKSFFGPKVFLSDSSSALCHWLTPGHCGNENSDVDIVFVVEGSSGLVKTIEASNSNGIIDRCQF